MEERVLAIDLSSKTGWAFMLSSEESLVLVASGQIPAIHEPPGKYPDNFVVWAYQIFGSILEMVERYAPDTLVIEETVAGSKSVYSQKILEYSHLLLARMIRETGIKSRYFLTGEWRVVVGAKMSKEEKLKNKEVKAYKAKTGATLARDKNNKVIGKIGKKHVNIRRANEIFGDQLSRVLLKKDEDEADALLLGFAYHTEKAGKK
jgi:Holliday junction resolvasome RuvABC endonuclease subunit